jgi:hypothetical protein
MKTKMMQTCEVLVEMDARDLARIHIKKHLFSPEFNKQKYRMSLRFPDTTPVFLFNNCLRQELMDAVVWQDFLKYQKCHD